MTRRTWSVVVCTLTASAVLIACGDETPVGAPRCEEAAAVLVAQSVPDADLVPCWNELPGGWTVNEVDIGSAGTIVELDSDRAGDEAAVFSYQPACDVARLGRLPSNRDDVEIREEIRSLAGGVDADRFFVFGGGCVKVAFSFADFDDISHAEALLNTLELVPREELDPDLVAG